ncbi:MAG: hypothetical protein AABX72_01550 [Nanoarchaeota archaeon]
MVSERLETIIERATPHSMFNDPLEGEPVATAYTVWYSTKNGIIIFIGDGNPQHDKPYVRCIKIKGDDMGPLGELAEDVRPTKAIQKVLDSLTQYRKQAYGK